jgi:hypothetical protein
MDSLTACLWAWLTIRVAGSHRPVGALAAVPGVLEFSRSRPPHPEIPGLRLPQP